MSTATGVEVDELVDLASVVACTAAGCPRPAVWRGIQTCHAHHYGTVCQLHHDAIIQWLASPDAEAGVYCLACDEDIPEPFVHWSRL